MSSARRLEPILNTYTYNAFGLNQTLLSTIPNYDDSKINAFRSTSELVVTVGHEVMPSTSIMLGNPYAGAVLDDKYEMIIPGKRIDVSGGGIHFSGPMVEAMLSKNSSVQMQWADITANRKALSHAFQDSSLYRQDNINIITY
mgnify:CR=1 FL=1